MLKFLNKFKSNYKKYAMTLAEVLMVFTIIGVVASITLYTAKPFDKNMKYAYAKAYDTLNVAFYNARTTLPAYLAPLEGGEANPLMIDRDWPANSVTFCKMLLEYINYKADVGDNDAFPNVGGSIPINQQDNNFDVANCSAPTIGINQSIETLNNALRQNKPHFVASNGMKFWIGHFGVPGRSAAYIFNINSVNGTPTEITFRVRVYPVIVDLNGDSRPNSVEITDQKVGDIVAFLVTDRNEVIPIGRPEVDRRYLSARVVYNVNIDQTAEASTSNTMTYYEAKRRSWAPNTGVNLASSSSNPMSFNYYLAGINATSAFFQSYSEPPYSTYNESTTVDTDWCTRTIVNPNGEQVQEVNPNACYVKITDYF